jgi:GNAT superfamily N-acetyltransferase
MFASLETARRIERAEAATTRAMADALIASGRAPGAFVHDVGGGVAAYVRAGSPINKVIGAGLDAAIDDAALAVVEQAMRAHDEPVRVELATLATPATGEQLTARGYRLLGFENVLALPLSAIAPTTGAIRIERMTAATTDHWKDTLVDGFACSDDSGVLVDHFGRDAIAAVIDDVLATRDFDRYLAYRGDSMAGAASMRVHDGVALLTGSATLPQHRRGGVQSALIAARLADAHARGAELAVITTAPGSQSQANVTRRGFALVYARAILVRD